MQALFKDKTPMRPNPAAALVYVVYVCTLIEETLDERAQRRELVS